jgi:cell division septum initiation protein DivIVA
VKAYLDELAKEFHELRERNAQLESELEAARNSDQPVVSAPPPPVERQKVDVVAITNALGEETARVLRTAQEAADDLRERAEAGAAKALSEAHEDAARMRADAEALHARRTAEAEESSSRVIAEAEEAADAMRAEAKEEAERTIAEAIEQGRDMLSQAQAARERVLADLGRRRKVGLAQIERLRGGREQLSSTLVTARSDIDRMIAALADADEEARRLEEAIAPHVVKDADEAVAEAPPVPEVAEPDAPEAAATPPAVMAEEVGAVVAGAAAPATDDTGTPAASTRAQAAGDDAGVGAVAATAGSPSTREPYKHDRVPAAVLPDEAVGGVEEKPKVDDLFARIRAERAGKVTAQEPAAEEEDGEDDGAPAPEDDALEAPRSDADESVLQRRDALLEAPLASLLRAVKRGLADEQNMALERLRKARTPTLDALLDDEPTHLARASRWAAAGLAACARAGSSLAGKPDAALPEEALAPAVARLAEELVLPVRQRAAALIADGGPDAADRLNSIYREARARIERVVGDAVTETVSNAFVAASEPGAPVRWVVDDPEGPCPDCDDNALAGAVPVGQPFPTGQVGPPAHPGCRCMLAPTPA